MNKKRYWLRGGLIATLIMSLLLFFGQSSEFDGLQFFIALLFILPIGIFAELQYGEIETLEQLAKILEKSDPWWNTPVTGFIFYILVGTFIGWLYGKVKNRINLSPDHGRGFIMKHRKIILVSTASIFVVWIILVVVYNLA